MTDNRTTELREKLTERGVEFATDDFVHLLTTSWNINDVFARYIESIGDYVDEDDPTLKLKMKHVTPEQAIATTLDGVKLTAEQVREAVMSADRWEKPMGNTGLTNTHLIIRDDGWQAIADELNAELGGGNCARCAEDMGRYADSLCNPLKERIAELLRCLENDWHIHASWDGLRKFWNIELTEEGVLMRDAELGRGTCEMIEDPPEVSGEQHSELYPCYMVKCSACGAYMWDVNPMRYCPNCGARVEKVDE